MEDSRNKRRAERIRAEIDIVRILADLGYDVRGGSQGQETQFSCDLHGDGKDMKPSARVYPVSNSWYCWACGKARDAVETIREKMGVGFGEALSWIEKQYGLPPMPWEPSDHKTTLSEELVARIDVAKTFNDDIRAFDSMMDSIVIDKMLPLDSCLSFWEARDKLVRFVTDEEVSETIARGTLLRLRDRILDTIKESVRA